MLSDLLRSHSALRTQVRPGRASLPMPRSLADASSFLRRHHPHHHLCPPPPHHQLRGGGGAGGRRHRAVTMAAGMVSLLRNYPGLESSPTPSPTLVLGSGVVSLGQTCRARTQGKGSCCPSTYSCTRSGPGPVRDAGVQKARPVLHLEELTLEKQTLPPSPGQRMLRGPERAAGN